MRRVTARRPVSGTRVSLISFPLSWLLYLKQFFAPSSVIHCCERSLSILSVMR